MTLPRQIDGAMADLPIIGPIEFDLPCTSCGYNLRGLTQTGRCPECGASIEVSLRGDLLCFANPRWLKSVRSGIDWMFVALALAVAVSALHVLRFLNGPAGIWMFIPLLMVIEGVPRLLAIWMITTPEPRVSFTDQQVNWRWVVRFCAAMSLALLLLIHIDVWRWSVAQHRVPWLMVFTMSSVAGIVATFGYFVYAEKLAKRVPDLRLAKSTRIVKWGLSGLQAMGMLGPLILMLVVFPMFAGGAGAGRAGLGFTLWRIAGIVSNVDALAILALLVWALCLLYRYGKVLREAINQAGSPEPRHS